MDMPLLQVRHPYLELGEVRRLSGSRDEFPKNTVCPTEDVFFSPVCALYDLNVLFWYLERNLQLLIGQKAFLSFSWNQPVPHQEQLCFPDIGILLFDESEGQVLYSRFLLRKEEQTGNCGLSPLCFFLLSWFCRESLSPGFGRHRQARPFARYVRKLADGFLYRTDYL